jgi:hypothetical protein
LMADEGQIRQALINLIRNAREALSGAGPKRLTISAAVAAGSSERLVLKIADSGAGIAPGDLAKIFDPFFSTKAQGTGLGLALVQQIVVDHGGQIDVDSVPGRGTTFTLAFPTRAAGGHGAGASSAAGGVAVGGGATPLAEPVVEGGEGQVQGGGIGRPEDERVLEGDGGGGALTGRGQGAA